MAASYPSAPKSFTTKTAGQTIASAHIDDLQDEVVAMETAQLTGGLAHGLFPSSAGAQHLGTTSLPWGTLYARALDLDSATTLTIASGVVTVTTRSNHALDTEGAAASDDLDTITATGPTDGFVLILRAANVARVVTLKDGTGNLLLNGDCALSATDRTITLVYDGSNWRELARSVTSASTTLTQLAATNYAGTSTSAGAATIDTVAVSGLGPRDSLLVYWNMFSATAGTVNVHLYSTTDAIALTNKANINANAGLHGDVRLNQDQSGATSLFYYNDSYESGGGGGRAGGVIALTTAWTGSWTLGLRHEGVTATGTLRYRWSVYRLLGT